MMMIKCSLGASAPTGNSPRQSSTISYCVHTFFKTKEFSVLKMTLANSIELITDTIIAFARVCSRKRGSHYATRVCVCARVTNLSSRFHCSYFALTEGIPITTGAAPMIHFSLHDSRAEGMYADNGRDAASQLSANDLIKWVAKRSMSRSLTSHKLATAQGLESNQRHEQRSRKQFNSTKRLQNKAAPSTTYHPASR